jgi:carbonic anhydrase
MAHWHKFLLGASLLILGSGPLYANPAAAPRAAGEQTGRKAGTPSEIMREPAADQAAAATASDECTAIAGVPENPNAKISIFYPFQVASIAPDEKALRATSEGGIMLVNGVQYTLQYIELPKQAALPISSVRYPMEARFVHRAADGTTAILSVPVTEGRANLALEKMLQKKSAKIDPNDLLPADRTAALMGQERQGCGGPVEKHYVMMTPVQVSAAQIRKFEQLF